jgi:hypothetical protein
MYALLHADLPGTLRFNPLAPLVVLAITVLAARAVYVMARDGEVAALPDGPVGTWTVKLLLAVLGLQVVVWGLRFFGLFGGPCPV